MLLELNLASIPDDCIKAECLHCKRIIGISSDDIYWDWENEVSDQREMGSEVLHQTYSEVRCPECGRPCNVEISIYEYPLGITNYYIIASDDIIVYDVPDMDNYIESNPVGCLETCVRCGQLSCNIDEDGYCSDCMDEFNRQVNSDD